MNLGTSPVKPPLGGAVRTSGDAQAPAVMDPATAGPLKAARGVHRRPSGRTVAALPSPPQRHPKRQADQMSSTDEPQAGFPLPERKARAVVPTPSPGPAEDSVPDLYVLDGKAWPASPLPADDGEGDADGAELVFEDDTPEPPAPRRLTPAQLDALVRLTDADDPALGLEAFLQALRGLSFERRNRCILREDGASVRLSLVDHLDAGQALAAHWSPCGLKPERLDRLGDCLIRQAGLTLLSGPGEEDLACFVSRFALAGLRQPGQFEQTFTGWLTRAFGRGQDAHPAYPYTGRAFGLLLLSAVQQLGPDAREPYIRWVLSRLLPPRREWAADDARQQWEWSGLQVQAAQVRLAMANPEVRLHPVLLAWMCDTLLASNAAYMTSEIAIYFSGLTAELPVECADRKARHRKDPGGQRPWAADDANFLSLLRPVLQAAAAPSGAIRRSVAVLGLAAGREHGLLKMNGPSLFLNLDALPGGLDRLVERTLEVLVKADLALARACVQGLFGLVNAAQPGDAKSAAGAIRAVERRILERTLRTALSTVGRRWTSADLTTFGRDYARCGMAAGLVRGQVDALVREIVPSPPSLSKADLEELGRLRKAFLSGLEA